jgi:hypothetical protein
MNQDKSTWEYVPGIMQLVEDGVEPHNLGGVEFVAPSVRGGGLISPGASPGQIGRLERLWNWLRGFRKEKLLCERLPIWMPIAQLWPAPDGQLEFSYQTSVEAEAIAEITLYSVVGFGGGGRLKLASSITLKTQGKGIAYLTRAFLTIHRYRHRSTGEEIDRVDVDCAGDYGEFDRQELAPESRPFGASPASLDEIREQEFIVSRVERCSNSNTETVIKLEQESLRNWKFELSPDLPLLKLPLSLAASCERARSFTTEFSLPAGRDYAFCASRGESPVAPVCVVLK